jgi:two-component system, chemotaxis family, chemotaxis protein CheY
LGGDLPLTRLGPLQEVAGLERTDVAKVLVVDDAAFMRLRACKVLQANGHDVVQAENGADAVRQYAEHHPDAVLMDITMPEMDGLAALKEIKRLDPTARVAMVTAMGQQAVVMEALKAGAKDFVLKPFQPDRVLNALNKLLAD